MLNKTMYANKDYDILHNKLRYAITDNYTILNS